MANAIHRTQRDYRGYLLRVSSINTPDYSTDDWLVNPDLSSVSGIPEYYWKVTGTPPGGSVEEMNPSEKSAVDSTRLSDAKVLRKTQLESIKERYLNSKYREEDRRVFNSMYAKGFKNKPKRREYLESYISWLEQVEQELITRKGQVDSANTLSEINSVSFDEETLDISNPDVTINQALNTSDASDLDNFLDSNVEVTDTLTGVKGSFHLMQPLLHRRELYNDTDNPVYHSSVTPILGNGGYLEDHANRILNIETIHNKFGWHDINVRQNRYNRPLDLLIYYGYPNSFNSSSNSWNNELVAQEMSKYNLIVFGNGVQDPSHPDYANTSVILPRIKELNPRAKIFGYVSINQEITPFQTAVDQWDTLVIHGIFLDEAGYDYGRTRGEFNTRVDYVHNRTNSNLCFANAWNTDHILGTVDDASYPNSTYNTSQDESNLTENDWVLLESWPVNTTAYSGNSGYESASDWYTRGEKVIGLRSTYKVNFAGSCVIDNGDVNGQDLFNFGFISSLMYSLEGFGTSDTNYGSGASVTLWSRPDTSSMGIVWERFPGVKQDISDTDKYLRYSENSRMVLDFSSGAQTSLIEKW